MQPTRTSCTFPDLQLTYINPILTQALFQMKQSSNCNVGNQDTDPLTQLTTELFQQTLTQAEHNAQSHGQKAIQEKNELDRTKSNHQNITSFETILNIINQRETNVINRVEHQTRYQILRLSQ